ncbi:hypothetical protein M3Y99_00923400 [Aphelenchoides fujianensis]|nr:hypothetical protein M3Y99_00923400 [Aphelenchoides fujianensis]
MSALMKAAVLLAVLGLVAVHETEAQFLPYAGYLGGYGWPGYYNYAYYGKRSAGFEPAPANGQQPAVSAYPSGAVIQPTTQQTPAPPVAQASASAAVVSPDAANAANAPTTKAPSH